jgi:hypothetical protein
MCPVFLTRTVGGGNKFGFGTDSLPAALARTYHDTERDLDYLAPLDLEQIAETYSVEAFVDKIQKQVMRLVN